MNQTRTAHEMFNNIRNLILHAYLCLIFKRFFLFNTRCITVTCKFKVIIMYKKRAGMHDIYIL